MILLWFHNYAPLCVSLLWSLTKCENPRCFEKPLLLKYRFIPWRCSHLVPQDTLGGGFDATQAYVGELAHLNIWNRKLSVAEIANLATCNSKAPVGNVFSWTENNIEIFGGATKWTFEPCSSINWTASPSFRKKRSMYFWAFLVPVLFWLLLRK